MNGQEILKYFFKLVHNHFNLDIEDFDEQVDNDYWSIQQIIDELKNLLQTKANINFLLDSLAENVIGNDFLIEDFIPKERIEFINFSTKTFSKRNRAFGYSNTEFGYLSLNRLLQIKEEIITRNDVNYTLNSFPSEYRTLIDFIGTAVSNNETAKLTNLLRHIKTSKKDIGILVHKIQHTSNSITTYSYIYYRFMLNGGKVELNKDLIYTGVHGATTNFSNVIKYQQYFEVFDVMNELNQERNLISRFLKVYHILEYLVYRVELVEIEKKARENRTFVRQIHSLMGKGQAKGEQDLLKKSFGHIFSVEVTNGSFNLNVTQNEKDFIKKFFGIKNFRNTPNNNIFELNDITELIYKIRNSIVHNKESEFHITITNPDDYVEVIDLIKRLIVVLERQIFDKISSDSPIIKYESQNIELY